MCMNAMTDLNVQRTFHAFLAADAQREMFIFGPAGTGKSSSICSLVKWCAQMEKTLCVLAFTHQACAVLRSKIGGGNAECVRTIHSFLGKVPVFDPFSAKTTPQSTESYKPPPVELLVVDEFSMCPRSDCLDLRHLGCKIVWVGDQYQLPPIRETRSFVNPTPLGPNCELSVVHRQAADNPLLAVLSALANMVKHDLPWTRAALVYSDALVRNTDLAGHYQQHGIRGTDILLAYTNKRVQLLNATIQGRRLPEVGDTVYSPTTRSTYTVTGGLRQKEDLLHWHTKYGKACTVYEHQMDSNKRRDYIFLLLTDEDGETKPYSAIFGYASYNRARDHVYNGASRMAKLVKQRFCTCSSVGLCPCIDTLGLNRLYNDKTMDAASVTLLARHRAAAAAAHSFLHYTLSLDFPHALTVHRSQGSTYRNVYLDIADIERSAALSGNNQCLRLMYVGLGRAAQRVFVE